MGVTWDRTFVGIRPLLASWQEIEERTDRSAGPAEVLERTMKRTATRTEGFCADVEFMRRGWERHET